MSDRTTALVSNPQAIRELGRIIHEERTSRAPVWIAAIGGVAAAGIAAWGAFMYFTSLTGYISTYAFEAFAGTILCALLAWVAIIAHHRTRYSYVFHAKGVCRLGVTTVDVIRFDERSSASVSKRNSQVRLQGANTGLRNSKETLIVRGYGSPPFTIIKERTRWLSPDEETPFDQVCRLANALNHERIAGDLNEIVVEP